MQKKYSEYKQLDLREINTQINDLWTANHAFDLSIKEREGAKEFIFFEGPPSANGRPGIHHVIARSIKDIFCRYKSMKGYHVQRKAGWDTHGLPVELGVEKSLGITKDDIGKKISVDEYNSKCRSEVMKYKDLWDKLTEEMGYWVDLKNPYITFKNEYIETLWFLLGELYKKGLLYKGYTIQPYSPAAGTGLSSHELSMPGCYRDLKDTTMVAQFAIKGEEYRNCFFIAWTTTPWTLPSNTALAVGNNIDYCWVDTFNPYSGQRETIVIGKPLLNSFFTGEGLTSPMEYKAQDKILPYRIIKECKGKDLVGMEYEQLVSWVKPDKGAFRVIAGDFVTTEDGTGIVHIAPTFGADDNRVAKQNGVPPLVFVDKAGKQVPMVDKHGKYYLLSDLDENFVKTNVNAQAYKEFEGKFVKNAYDDTKTDKDITLDVEVALALKQRGQAFKIEKHVHNYPHCWRTDKPILYYPLDSWFIKTTALKDRLIELNKTINWKPQATGSGRFGNWLENLVDWNLSRSRYWGTPLPIWRTEDETEEKCITSVKMLSQEIDKAVAKGYMKENSYAQVDNYDSFDLHRPYIDNVILVSDSGKPMKRETDLIDVWFDSGAMPYAQLHYPFECSKEELAKHFPADFIAEGVDQTRGWFFTLHALGTLIFDSVAYKNVVSNGLVLDKNGNKMSKRLGNAVDPFEIIEKYGADATRWYMISNSQPWENLKFDSEGIDEVRRKFFGTIYNTYSFFALYANIDGFTYAEKDIDFSERPEIDRWILSELNTLIKKVDADLNDYEPTKGTREISTFVDECLSNWYVRLCRRRFWRGEYSQDKISAYQTLYTCLDTLARLIAPFAPFFAERMFLDLNNVSGKEQLHNQPVKSVHLTLFPVAKEECIDKRLEQRMEMTQKVCSMVLSLRKRNNLKVRQPLAKIIIPVLNPTLVEDIKKEEKLILSEVNIKEIEFVTEDNNVLVKKVKANFKTLGPKYGKNINLVVKALNSFTQKQIVLLEQGEAIVIDQTINISVTKDDVQIVTEDIPGWVVMNEGALTVALDTQITPALQKEAIARELINRIQNIRKENFEVTDYINVEIENDSLLKEAIYEYHDYICGDILCSSLTIKDTITNPFAKIDVIEGKELSVAISLAKK
jgi:isoleucyl-tRNA synthetase